MAATAGAVVTAVPRAAWVAWAERVELEVALAEVAAAREAIEAARAAAVPGAARAARVAVRAAKVAKVEWVADWAGREVKAGPVAAREAGASGVRKASRWFARQCTHRTCRQKASRSDSDREGKRNWFANCGHRLVIARGVGSMCVACLHACGHGRPWKAMEGMGMRHVHVAGVSMDGIEGSVLVARRGVERRRIHQGVACSDHGLIGKD